MGKKVNKNYKINDGHVFIQDGKSDEIMSYFNSIIHDKEENSVDCNFYNEEERIKYIKLCVNFDNYFANLASILNFVVETESAEKSKLGVILKKIEKDLLYLQKNYTIIKRENEEKDTLYNF